MTRNCSCIGSGPELCADGKYKSIPGWSAEGLTLQIKTIEGDAGTLELVEELASTGSPPKSQKDVADWMAEASNQTMLIRHGSYVTEKSGKRVIMTLGPPEKPTVSAPGTPGRTTSPSAVEHLAATKQQRFCDASSASLINTQLENLAAVKRAQAPQLKLVGRLMDKFEMEQQLQLKAQLRSDPQHVGHFNTIRDCESFLCLEVTEGCFWSKAAGVRLEGDAWLAFHPAKHGASSCVVS